MGLVARVQACIGFALLVAMSASIASAGSETLYLDLREKAKDHFAGPVRTEDELTRGKAYCIRVTGTGSLWDEDKLEDDVCGDTEKHALFPSSESEHDRVGIDPEIWFAVPEDDDDDDECEALGHHHRFKINLGDGYEHLEPENGEPEEASPGHTYVYRVIGRGEEISFRYEDDSTCDNYGRFQIVVSKWSDCATAVEPALWSTVKRLYR